MLRNERQALVRYFFDIAISINDSVGSARYDWWNRYAMWRRNVFSFPGAFEDRVHSFALQVFVDEGMAAITSPLEHGVTRDVLDAVIALVQRYLREVPGTLPVSFTYAAIVREDGTEQSEPYRRYDGGAVFITKDKIYEETAFDRLIAIQERVAKMGDAVDTEDDEQAGSIHPKLEHVDELGEDLPVLLSLEDALRSCAARHPDGQFDTHSYVASAMFGYPYVEFVGRKDTIIVPDAERRLRLVSLRNYVKRRTFAHAFGAIKP